MIDTTPEGYKIITETISHPDKRRTASGHLIQTSGGIYLLWDGRQFYTVNQKWGKDQHRKAVG